MINGNRMKSGRERHIRDFYETPYALADAAIQKIRYDEELGYDYPVDGLDAGCGNGVWGKAAVGLCWAGNEDNVYANIDGIDIETDIKEFSQYYCKIFKHDFLTFVFGNISYDIVFGNPPYSLAEEFVRKAMDIVVDNGYVYFLLRLSFLEGIKRGWGLFKELPLKRVYVCSRRPSFYSIKNRPTTDTLAYAMFLWQKGYEGKPEIDWLDWSYK